MTNQEYAEKIASSEKKIQMLENLCRALRKEDKEAATGAENEAKWTRHVLSTADGLGSRVNNSSY